jgi:sarcosine oxidase
MGSSHDLAWIIRLADHEDPSYVPLLRRATALWRKLEPSFGAQVVRNTCVQM